MNEQLNQMITISSNKHVVGESKEAVYTEALERQWLV